MRITTKLKRLQFKYSVQMDEIGDQYSIQLTDKETGEKESYTDFSFSNLIHSAYRNFIKSLKEEEKDLIICNIL